LTFLLFILLEVFLLILTGVCSDSFLVDADLDRVALTGLPSMVVSVLQLFFSYTVFLHEMLPAVVRHDVSKISDNIIIHYIIYLFLLLVSVLLPARMMTMAMSLKSDTSEEESEIAFYLYVIVVQVIWTAAIWVFKGGALEWDAKPRKCFVDVWAWLFDEAPYNQMPGDKEEQPGDKEEQQSHQQQPDGSWTPRSGNWTTKLREEIEAAVKEAAKLPPKEGKKKLRDLRLKWHPDKHPDLKWMADEVTKIINDAVDRHFNDAP